MDGLKNIGKKLRSTIATLAQHVNKFDKRLSHRQLLRLSAQCAPSSCGKNFFFDNMIYFV